MNTFASAYTLPPLPPSPQLEAAKKAYHLACKEEKLAMTREMNSKTEQSVTPEQQKKLQDKVDKCKQDVQKVLVGLGSQGPLEWVAAGSCRPGSHPPPHFALVPIDTGEV